MKMDQMTTRFNALTVALEHNIREDEAESLLQAIGHLRGVLAVTGIPVEPQYYTGFMRAKAQLTAKIWRALDETSDETAGNP